ncbi:MAG: phosphotransferase [Psychromonas sp.]|nr:phosphotransferase [Psychromonas sp.]
MSLLAADELTWLAGLQIGKIVNVQQFKDARTNQVFLLTDDNALQAVFKRLNLKARDRRSRERELAVHKLASERRLSPAILADCDKYRLQEYIPGNTLASQTVAQHTVELLAAQLQIIHQLPACYASPQALAVELQRLRKQLNSQLDECEFLRFLHLATELDKSSAKDILCHGDLSLNNVLHAENGRIHILDWEYAVLACPAYDLAACSAVNALSAEQQAQLLNHYYFLHQEHLSLSLAQLQNEYALYLSLFTYLNKLWSLCF